MGDAKPAAPAGPGRVLCVERPFPGASQRNPVKLVVFDFDETLTLSTFMLRPGQAINNEMRDRAALLNFETPWVAGCRIDKLATMFSDMVQSADGTTRQLAVLTKNTRGPRAVLELLEAAGLARHLSAIWAMPQKEGRCTCAYVVNGKWVDDEISVDGTMNKATIICDIADRPGHWLPQLAAQDRLKAARSWPREAVVLVDDQESNFCPSGPTSAGKIIRRFVQVERYDAMYHSFGLVEGMGGIGAKDDADYASLVRFVTSPWEFSETFQARENSEFLPAVSPVAGVKQGSRINLEARVARTGL